MTFNTKWQTIKSFLYQNNDTFQCRNQTSKTAETVVAALFARLATVLPETCAARLFCPSASSRDKHGAVSCSVAEIAVAKKCKGLP